MARERSRLKPDESRWPFAPKPALDPIGRLDDVLAILEEMLDDREGRSGPSAHGLAGSKSLELPEAPEHPSGDPEALPLLRDVVAAPAADDDPGGTGGESEPAGAAGPEEDGPELAFGRDPLRFGFEIIPEDPLPRVDEVDLAHDPADSAPGGERYGDAPPPSLDPEVYRHLIDRLANEIDVIIQTGTEEAMQRAAADIAARVREHVAITLPEVIGELVRISSQPSD